MRSVRDLSEIPQSDGLSTEEILKDIDYYASIYEGITDPDQDTKEGVFFHRLDVLDTRLRIQSSFGYSDTMTTHLLSVSKSLSRSGAG